MLGAEDAQHDRHGGFFSVFLVGSRDRVVTTTAWCPKKWSHRYGIRVGDLSWYMRCLLAKVTYGTSHLSSRTLR